MKAAAVLVAGLLLAVLGRPATAESLVAATSTTVVKISSNFSGTDVTVFGTIERDRATVSRAEEYRLAVQLVGPRETVVARRKERRFGLWINRESRVYVDVPSFYAVLTTGSITELATPATLKRYQVGLDNMLLPVKAEANVEETDPELADFRAAFLRLKLKTGLYQELPGTVSFLTPNLFRATVPLPANVPVGRYRVQVVLFQEGVPLAEHGSDIVVSKSGFEQFVFDLAFSNPVLYGLGSVSLALLTGWLGGVLFRRD
jgi:uncharacterized protein (TIGR02186 family)